MNMTKHLAFALVSACAGTLSLRAAEHVDLSKIDLSKLPPAAQKSGVTFATDIQPLFKESCVRCHGEDRPKAGLKLTSLENVLKGGKDGKVVSPGKSKDSVLVVAVARIDEELAMPPKRGGGRGPGGAAFGGPPNDPNAPHSSTNTPPPGRQNRGFGPPPKPLTSEQVGLVRAWIDQGAK
jgi:hypothetical protein